MNPRLETAHSVPLALRVPCRLLLLRQVLLTGKIEAL